MVKLYMSSHAFGSVFIFPKQVQLLNWAKITKLQPKKQCTVAAEDCRFIGVLHVSCLLVMPYQWLSTSQSTFPFGFNHVDCIVTSFFICSYSMCVVLLSVRHLTVGLLQQDLQFVAFFFLLWRSTFDLFLILFPSFLNNDLKACPKSVK